MERIYYTTVSRGISWFGLLLVVMGGLWLADEVGWIDFRWGFFWPVLIIVIGLSMVLNRLLAR